MDNKVFHRVYGTIYSLYKYYKVYLIILFICLIAAYLFTLRPLTYNLVYFSEHSINNDHYDNLFNFHKIVDFDPEILYHLEKQEALDRDLRKNILKKINSKINNNIRNLNQENFILLIDEIKSLDKNLIDKIISCIKSPELFLDDNEYTSSFIQITCNSKNLEEFNIISKYIEIAINKITLKSSKDTIEYLLNYYQSNMNNYLNDYEEIISKRFNNENGNINDLLAYVFGIEKDIIFDYKNESDHKERTKRIFSSKFYKIIKNKNFYKDIFITSRKVRIYDNDKGYIPYYLSFITSFLIYLLLVIIIENMKEYLKIKKEKN